MNQNEGKDARGASRLHAELGALADQFECHAASRGIDEIEEAGRAMRAAKAELERLSEALKKANDQAEHFEREWYLRGDALERAADVARNACEGWNDALMHEGARIAADAVQALLVPNA